MSENDPYTTPSTDPTAGTPPPKVVGSPRTIIWAWERLRLRYNLILLIPGVAILIFYTTRIGIPFGGAASGGFVMAIGANLGFFLGPLSEMYSAATLDKPELPKYRKFAFWAGVIGSLALFGVTMVPGIIYSQLLW